MLCFVARALWYGRGDRQVRIPRPRPEARRAPAIFESARLNNRSRRSTLWCAHSALSTAMDFMETVCLMVLLLRKRGRKQRKIRYWVLVIASQRLLKGQFYKLQEELQDHPNKLFQYYRLSMNSFDAMLQPIGPKITKLDKTWRKSVPPEEEGKFQPLIL